MAIFGSKVFLGIAATLLTGSAALYGGAGLINNIQDNIQALEDKAELLHDEAWSKGRIANGIIAEKNAEITRLEAEVNRLEDEVQISKDELAKAETEITKANGELAKAEADIQETKDVSDVSVAKVNNLPELGGVTDDKAQVIGKKLDIAVVSSQSVRTVKFVNHNTVDVTVNYDIAGGGGTGSVTVPAGDVVYENIPTTAIFTYTVPSGSAETVTK